MYYKNAGAVALVYDITNQESFDSINKWMKEIDNHILTNSVLLALVANKCDMS